MEQATLPGLYFTLTLEMIAERVDASPQSLKSLNPGKSFVPGEEIAVPNTCAAFAPKLEPKALTKNGPSSPRRVMERIPTDGEDTGVVGHPSSCWVTSGSPA